MPKIGFSGKLNSEDIDIYWFFFFLFFGIMMLMFLTIGIEEAWADIYWEIFVISVMIFLASKILPKFFNFKSLNSENILQQIGAGWAIMLALSGGVITAGAFAVLSPLDSPTLAIFGIAGVGSLFLLSIATAEIEETFRNGMRNMFEGMMKHKKGVVILLLSSGLMLYFLFNIALIGLGMMVVAVILGLTIGTKYEFSRFFESELAGRIVSIGAAASIFAGLHYAAYQAAVPALINAFIFAVIADSINSHFKSHTSGKIGHCGNNAVMGTVALQLPIWYAIFITTVYSGILYMLSKKY